MQGACWIPRSQTVRKLLHACGLHLEAGDLGRRTGAPCQRTAPCSASQRCSRPLSASRPPACLSARPRSQWHQGAYSKLHRRRLRQVHDDSLTGTPRQTTTDCRKSHLVVDVRICAKVVCKICALWCLPVRHRPHRHLTTPTSPAPRHRCSCAAGQADGAWLPERLASAATWPLPMCEGHWPPMISDRECSNDGRRSADAVYKNRLLVAVASTHMPSNVLRPGDMCMMLKWMQQTTACSTMHSTSGVCGTVVPDYMLNDCFDTDVAIYSNRAAYACLFQTQRLDLEE